SCKSCVAKKALEAKKNGLFKPILVSKPHEIVGLDFNGPLPKTKTGYEYILDVMFIPLKKLRAETAGEAFVNQWICIFGFPHKIF
ncbi:hypothetical protein O9G_006390, partial [Rozella allomycis CSF55]